jgi:hypothetical protein
MADTVASWIKAGYAAGPFDEPPTQEFRVNSLMAVDQGKKIRPILNVSLPEGLSFNDNVDTLQCEKIKMATARKISHMILAAGRNCVIYKTDIRDAYKIVPARLQDLNLQGFSFLEKFFVETRMIFGATTAVCNYDTVGSVPLLLALLDSQIPHKLVDRAVDDVICISPHNQQWGEEFCNKYRTVCAELNIAIADDCPNFDKAFSNSTYGKVLGKWFNTKDLSWKLDESKRAITLQKVRNAFHASHLTIKEVQSLSGRLNDIATMYPMLKIFRFEINAAVSRKIEANDN